MMKDLVTLLKAKHYTIASIESLTAGLFTAKIAEVSGASAVLKGGLVTYMTSCKADVLHIDEELINTYGVISPQIVKAMAQQGSEMFDTDIVVSFSGNAGPDVMENKPVGLVYMGIAFQGKIYVYDQIFKGSRNEVREKACAYMEKQLISLLK